jgi:predicted ATPase
MEYVSGGSLRELLRQQQQLSVRRVLEIGLELADALTRAHHLNIIHRDIKPANVLLSADGTARLVDFGVARIGDTTRVTKTGSIVGTYAYLPPEAFTGGELDVHSDIWAFGVLLFEMLTGQRPFEGPQPGATMLAIMNMPTPSLASVRAEMPPALAALVEAMLVKNPDQRIASARLVGAELEAILHGIGTSTKTSTASATDSTPPSFTPPPSYNIPQQPTAFLGRAEELTEIRERLENAACRLLTLLGPGGIGKTRLAIEAAMMMHDRTGLDDPTLFIDGVFFVPLAPLNSAEYLVSAITEVLKFAFYVQDNSKSQLLNYLRGRRMLLVLDNFEHILDGATLLTEILHHAPHVKFMVTSRERLNLQEEWVLQVDGMPVPEHYEVENLEDYAAIQLFVQSARQVDAAFALVEDFKPGVVRICRLVQGMPLGIELAAAWVRMLAVSEIADEIERNLDFLATTMRNVPERHRSLRAVFEYSWTLISEREREVFRKLSVFRGGFTREAAQQIAGADLPLLMTLVDKSLLGRNASGRYDVHMLLRQYAGEKLHEHPAALERVKDLHSEFYAEFLAQRQNQLKGDKQMRALREIEEEMKNIRAGCRWAAEQGKTRELELYVETLDIFFDIRGWLQEAVETFGAVVSALRSVLTNPQRSIVFAKTLARHGTSHLALINMEEAKALLDEALSIVRNLDDPSETAFILNGLGNEARFGGRFDEARLYYEESLALREQIEDRWRIAHSLSNMAYLANVQGEFEEARALGERSLEIRRGLGDMLGVASSLKILGSIHYNMGEYQKTRRILKESVSIRRKLGDKWGVAFSLMELGDVSREMGDYSEALSLFDECMRIFGEFGDHRGEEIALVNLGRIHNAMGEYNEGLRYCQASLDICRELDLQWGVAFALHHLGNANFGLGDFSAAKRNYYEALRVASALAATLTVYVMVGVAKSLMQDKERELAAELLTMVLKHPRSNKETRDEARRLLGTLEEDLRPADFEAAEERGKTLELDDAVPKVLK